MNKLNNYHRQGMLGLSYFLRFIKEQNDDYLKVIKDNSTEIKFWTLVTFLSNNHDILYNEISEILLNKLFTMQPIQRAQSNLSYEDGSYYDYGIGIKTDSELPYKEQFKLIRNAIIHQDFEINKGIISINNTKDNFRAIFDIKWLESLVLCVLSNKNFNFYKGQSDHLMICDNTGDFNKDSLINMIKNRKLMSLVITLNSNSREKVLTTMNYKVNNEVNFDDIFTLVIEEYKNLISKERKDNSTDFYTSINKVLNILNKRYKGVINLEITIFDISKVIDLINLPDFSNIDEDLEKLILLENHYHMQTNADKANTLSYKYTLELLKTIEEGKEITPLMKCYLNEIYAFIVKSFGNLAFNIPLPQNISYSKISEHILSQYEKGIIIDSGHYKNCLKERLKHLNTALKELAEHPTYDNLYYSQCEKVRSEIKEVTEKISLLESGKNPDLFLARLRNAFTHGFCNIEKDNVHLYNKEKKRYYPKFNKKSSTWEQKEVDKTPIVFNAYMSYGILMNIIKYLASINKIPLKAPQDSIKQAKNIK